MITLQHGSSLTRMLVEKKKKRNPKFGKCKLALSVTFARNYLIFIFEIKTKKHGKLIDEFLN